MAFLISACRCGFLGWLGSVLGGVGNSSSIVLVTEVPFSVVWLAAATPVSELALVLLGVVAAVGGALLELPFNDCHRTRERWFVN